MDKRQGASNVATSQITESGFVRIVSDPAFSRDALTPEQARNVLTDTINDAHAKFWPDSISYVKALDLLNRRVVGHQQITDAYLLGLAIHNRGKLATFDRAIAGLLPPGSPPTHVIEILALS